MKKLISAYDQSILDWRKQKEESLRGEHGWLALEGLNWLNHGKNTFGTAPDNQVVISNGDLFCGVFELLEKQVYLYPIPSTNLTVAGQAATKMELLADVSGNPTIISLGCLDMMVIQRGDLFGVRVWNKCRPERINFPERRWYPIRPEFITVAGFSPQEEREVLQLPAVSGLEQELPVAGILNFLLDGRSNSLIALDEGDGSLFVIFKDLTSQDSTYPAGRYLYPEVVSGGKVELDFNRAYNPPCAFTEYATCPLPPRQNHLPVRIEAGELFSQERK